MTHFASAEMAGLRQAGEQRRRFKEALMETAEAQVIPEWVSVGNTSGLDLVEGPEDFLSWVARLAGGVNAEGDGAGRGWGCMGIAWS